MLPPSWEKLLWMFGILLWTRICETTLYYVRRVQTVLKAFFCLLALSSKTLNDFLDSYTLYNYDWPELKTTYSPSQIQTKLRNYYHVMPFVLSFGSVEKMYIPPVLDPNKNILENQNLFEEVLINALEVKPHDKVLDIGCGRGLVALHITEQTKCDITGINIEANQISFAQENFRKHKQNNFTFKVQDMNEFPLPFANDTFDAIYEIQAFSLASNLEQLIQEVARVLKPGGRLIVLDWVKLNAFKEEDTYHNELLRAVKPLIGAIGTLRENELVEMIGKYFLITEAKDLSAPYGQSLLIQQEDAFFTRLTRVVQFLVKWKILQPKLSLLLERLTLGGKDFIQADRLKIVTTSYYIVGEKSKI